MRKFVGVYAEELVYVAIIYMAAVLMVYVSTQPTEMRLVDGAGFFRFEKSTLKRLAEFGTGVGAFAGATLLLKQFYIEWKEKQLGASS